MNRMNIFASLLLVWQLFCLLPTTKAVASVILLASLLLSTDRYLPSMENGTLLLESKLKDRFTMLELHDIDNRVNSSREDLRKLNEFTDTPTICEGGQSTGYKQKILKGIEKSLKFYEGNLDKLDTIETDLGLSVLRGVDNKHGKRFQKYYSISEWIATLCPRFSLTEMKARNWKHAKSSEWKSAQTIVENRHTWKSVGEEKEHLWGKLNAECQLALVNDCEIPYVCERTLYDPEPKSQYFLTHQVFQRILTEQAECSTGKDILNEEVNKQLVSKMFQEAMLVAQMDYPHILRDLFAEYIFFGGFMRYPNFFRKDWINALLSWQSKSEFGCYNHDKEYKSAFITSDFPITRNATAEEVEKGLVPDEQCRPHFTAVALSALAMSWDYIEENCP